MSVVTRRIVAVPVILFWSSMVLPRRPDGFDGRGELRQIIQGDIVPTEGKISRKGLPAVPGAEHSDFLHDSSLGRGAASAPLGGYSRTKVEMTSS